MIGLLSIFLALLGAQFKSRRRLEGRDMIQIQTAFMQKQMAVFSEQAKAIAETYTKALGWNAAL